MHMSTSFKDHCYDYTFIMKEKATDSSVAYLLYRFKSAKTNRQYYIIVEEHPDDFYAVKFHPRKFTGKNKYNTITNIGEAVRPIVYTCVSVMLDIAINCPLASFGFIGSNTKKFSENNFIKECKVNETLATRRKKEKENEDLKLTQRYRIYHRIVSTLISQKEFFHQENEDISCFALFRHSKIQSNPSYIDNTIDYFRDNYEDIFFS